MKHLNIMVKPASSLCNLRCKYCFYGDVADQREIPCYGLMSEATVDAMLQNIRGDLEAGDCINFAFQGGEPTLAGLSFYEQFSRKVSQWQDIRVRYALQTNGILLDEVWCAFLKKHGFLVGISWDILSECHDSARVDPMGRGTNRAVLQAIGLLEKWGVDYNILCTLTGAVARYPNQVWKQLLRHNVRYVQFTPCLDALEIPGESAYALTPDRFAAFYDRIFALWYQDFQRGKYRSIKLIDDVVNLLAWGRPTACGINGCCSPQLVVEADGSVYPCDFYCLDHYCLGNLAGKSLREIMENPKAAAFRDRPHIAPKLCAHCEFARFCGGNCKRMQRQICCAPEDDFCGYQDFLRRNQKELMNIARLQHTAPRGARPQ